VAEKQRTSDGGNVEGERHSRGIPIGETIAALAAHAGINPDGLTLRELKAAALAAWSKHAKIEAAIRDGLTPRRDKSPWDHRLFNPFIDSVTPYAVMSGDEIKQYRGMCKTHTIVKASEVRVKE
jgi:hypothetical protein